MKKKILLVMMMSVFALQMTACGKEAAPAETEPAETTEAVETTENTENTENTELANPWTEITEEQATAKIPNSFSAPEGATNVVWRAMGDMDPSSFEVPGPVIELDFDLNDMSFTAREQITGDDNQDISGMFYDWTVTNDITLANWADGNMPAKASRYVGDSESADLVTWYDVEIGISYSLSTVAKDLDGFDPQAIVEAMYDPNKQASAGIPDDADEHVPMDITGCDTFTQIVDKLQAGQGYANVTIADKDVLLVASGTYDYDGDGKKFVAIDADVYEYNADGKIQYLGYVECGGTAYPLSVKDGVLYVGNNHGMKKMTITEFDLLAVDENAYVDYDSDGNGTYYYTSDIRTVNEDPDAKYADDSKLNEFYADYEKAEMVEFNTVQ